MLPPIDHFGRTVNVGDAIYVTGTVESLTEATGVNAVMLLDQLTPPSGAQVRVNLNTTQAVLVMPGPPPGQELEPPPDPESAKQKHKEGEPAHSSEAHHSGSAHDAKKK